MNKRINLYSDPHRKSGVHFYANDPAVYFIHQRNTSVHIATLAFDGDANGCGCLCVEALLAICQHRLQNMPATLQRTEALRCLQKADIFLAGENLNDTADA